MVLFENIRRGRRNTVQEVKSPDRRTDSSVSSLTANPVELLAMRRNPGQDSG